jgi:hypothetical protein
VRFVALRGPEPTTVLRFHPRVTVLAGFSDALAEWLANVFANGRSGAPDGFAVTDGIRVALAELPDAAFLAGRCPLVRAGALEDDLRLLRQGTRDELGFELRALVGAIAAARARSEAIVRRIAELDDEIAQADARTAEMRASHPATLDDDLGPDRADDADRLEQLLEAVVDSSRLEKESHPDAEAIASALDALDHSARRYRPRDEVEEELRKWELVTAEARSRLAERRATAPRVSPTDLAEATRLHSALRAATDRKNGVLRRRPGDEVAALELELRELLARLGARSYDDLMLLGSGLGSANVDLAIREATNVVAAAERRCADLRQVLAEPDIDEMREQRAALIEQARAVLGTDPGSSPAEALRELRVEPQAYVDAQVALAARLRELDAHVDVTMVESARRLIDQWREESARNERGRARVARFEDELEEAERVARQGRTMRARLAREVESRRTEIEDLEFDRERLERANQASADVDTTAVTPAIVDRVVADMLTAPGAPSSILPVIVDDPFGPLEPELRREALAALARRAGTSQIVLVTADAATVQWAIDAGDDVAIAWTAQDAAARVIRQTA